MAQTIGDLLSRYAQQAVGAATGAPVRNARTGPRVGPTAVSRQSITPVDRGNWFEQQVSAPWVGQAGDAAEKGGDLLGKVGGWAMDAFGPDVQAYKDVLSGDADMRDLASIGLDAAMFVPGVGLAGRTAGKLALKGAVKTAGKEGIKHATAASAKGSAIRSKPVRKELGELLGKGGKNAGGKGPGVVRRQFTDPNLAASKSYRSAGAAKKTAPRSPTGNLAGAGAPSALQRGAGNVSSKLLNAQRKMAPENLYKPVNKALGRNKARLGLTSTSRTSTALKLGAIGARNGIQDLLAANPSGPGADQFTVDFGDGAMQMPGDAMIGYVVGGGGGGGGNVQPMTVAQAAAALSAGSLQSGGSWVRLS